MLLSRHFLPCFRSNSARHLEALLKLTFVFHFSSLSPLSLLSVGVAEGGVPVNLENSIDQVNKGQNAGEIASALVGVSQVYPDVQKYIADHLYPNGTEAFAKVKDQCIGKDLTQFQNQDIFSYFTVTEDEFKAADPIRKVFNATLLGQPGSPLPQMPLYIYHSVNDEIVNGADEDDYVSYFFLSFAVH